jgi:hypothetical protein
MDFGCKQIKSKKRIWLPFGSTIKTRTKDGEKKKDYDQNERNPSKGTIHSNFFVQRFKLKWPQIWSNSSQLMNVFIPKLTLLLSILSQHDVRVIGRVNTEIFHLNRAAPPQELIQDGRRCWIAEFGKISPTLHVKRTHVTIRFGPTSLIQFQFGRIKSIIHERRSRRE